MLGGGYWGRCWQLACGVDEKDPEWFGYVWVVCDVDSLTQLPCSLAWLACLLACLHRCSGANQMKLLRPALEEFGRNATGQIAWIVRNLCTSNYALCEVALFH